MHGIIPITAIINLYIWILIINAILSWLVAFNVVNSSNQFVYMVMNFVYRITEPALRPIRNFLPDLGGIDVSPIVLIFGLLIVNNVLVQFGGGIFY